MPVKWRPQSGFPPDFPHRSGRRREDRILTSPARRMAGKCPTNEDVWMGKSGENLEWPIAMFEYRTQRSWQMVNSKRLWLGWPIVMRGVMRAIDFKVIMPGVKWPRWSGGPLARLRHIVPWNVLCQNDSGSMLYPWLKNNSYMATILPWMLKNCLMRQQGNNWRARSWSSSKVLLKVDQEGITGRIATILLQLVFPKCAESAEPHKLSWSQCLMFFQWVAIFKAVTVRLSQVLASDGLSWNEHFVVSVI